MFKDSFNCLNDVHKRCILNSIEFCTHLEILKKNFQGCLSVQLSKFIAFKLSIYLCLRSFCVAHLSWRLDYNITYQVLCQQLFSIFVIFFQSDNILYVKFFHQHYLHQLFVQYAHKHLWQIKSHSCLMNGLSGEDGIRTHAPVKTNGFQDRPVMTTSVPLHSYFIVSHQRLDYIIITV